MTFVSQIFIDEALSYEYEGKESGVQGTDKLKGISLPIDADESVSSDPFDNTKDDTWQLGKDRYPKGSLFADKSASKECGCGPDKNGNAAGTRGSKLSKEAIQDLFG